MWLSYWLFIEGTDANLLACKYALADTDELRVRQWLCDGAAWSREGALGTAGLAVRALSKTPDR